MQRQDIAAHIRNARPARLRVVLNDDTDQKVAMPRGRNRADKAAGVIDDMPWASVYMLDAKGDAIGVFHREDSAPAAELEELPKNPTMAIVHTVMSQSAAVLRQVHEVATKSAVDLVTKVRNTHKDEMALILDNYAKALSSANERAKGFQDRCDDLTAENDDLRDELNQLRQQQTPTQENNRERALIKLVTGVDVGSPGNNNAPGDEHPGANGVNGAG